MRRLLLTLALLLPVFHAQADEGLIRVESAHGVPETLDRLEAVLKEKGMTVFIRVRHSESAEQAGFKLRPTELLIFGNPKVGTPLMQCGQTAAIDLPQKALVWEDDAGKVWLGYNDPRYLAERHGLADCEEVIAKVEKALANFASAATKP